VDLPGAPLGLAVAAGVGLLVGIERERRKGRGDEREAAGLRTFTIASITGALAELLAVPGLVVAGAVLVALLGTVSHWKSRSRDPGLTTELALFTTYLIGVQCAIAPLFGAACGVALAGLLVARERLHRFATRLLSEQELHDGLLLAALALIVLPLIPSRPIEALGGIDPRPLAALVLLILALQAAGHVALRWLGVRGGLLVSGFFSGFVSSTATVASFGGRARSHPEQTRLLAGGAALSAVATWVQFVVMCAALSPRAALALLPAALAGAAGALAVGLLALRATSHRRGAPPLATPGEGALRLREAVLVALTLGGAAVLVGSAQRHFGDVGLGVGVALAAVVDAQAPVTTLASLHAAGTLGDGAVVRAVLIAAATNTLTRAIVAAVAGGHAYALRVGAALGTSLALAVAVGLGLNPR
jgi:uncharacterized membrane protein (DUF4010 family)